MFDDRYYRDSGRAPLMGVVAGLAAGVVAAVALSFVYAYANLYVPIVYVSIVLGPAFGAAIGFSTVSSLIQFKVRSTAVRTLVTLFVTLFGFYFCWIVWLFVLLRKCNENPDLWFMLLHPSLIWDLVLDVNNVGVWKLSENADPETGVFLWSVWAVEALAIFGVPIAIVSWWVAAPFCEECETWCEKLRGIAVLALLSGDEADSLRARMEARDFSYLDLIGPAPLGAFHWTQLDLHVCPNCGKTATLTVNEVSLKFNGKGQPTTAAKTIVSRLLLDAAQLQALIQTCSQIEAKRMAAIEAAPSLDEWASSEFGGLP